MALILPFVIKKNTKHDIFYLTKFILYKSYAFSNLDFHDLYMLQDLDPQKLCIYT